MQDSRTAGGARRWPPTIFNCVGVALVLPFLSPIARWLGRVIPDAARNATPEQKDEAAAPAQ